MPRNPISEAFEQWARFEGYDVTFLSPQREYKNKATADMWRGWQAGVQAYQRWLTQGDTAATPPLPVKEG